MECILKPSSLYVRIQTSQKNYCTYMNCFNIFAIECKNTSSRVVQNLKNGLADLYHLNKSMFKLYHSHNL
eukprot:snap_masked-scaffold_22-processed-gene-3.23-mRNA-1 protein AED:1.00 eAED:1.00 QI:0/0/0/0/1/1/2/0/69